MTQGSPQLLNVGIIGAGAISSRHFEGYRLAGANVVAFADPSEATRQSREEEWQARGYADFGAMLERDVRASAARRWASMPASTSGRG